MEPGLTKKMDEANKSWRTNRHKRLNLFSTSLQSRRWAHIKRWTKYQ